MATRTGLWNTCFLVLAMFGRPATAGDVHRFLAGDGEEVTQQQVKRALHALCHGPRARAECAARGGGRGRQSWYRLSEHGRAVLAED